MLEIDYLLQSEAMNIACFNLDYRPSQYKWFDIKSKTIPLEKLIGKTFVNIEHLFLKVHYHHEFECLLLIDNKENIYLMRPTSEYVNNSLKRFGKDISINLDTDYDNDMIYEKIIDIDFKEFIDATVADYEYPASSFKYKFVFHSGEFIAKFGVSYYDRDNDEFPIEIKQLKLGNKKIHIRHF